MARALFALLAAIVAATVYLFSKTWMPALANPSSDGVDHQITLNFILLGIVFCATQVALGLFVWKYRSGRNGERVSHARQPRLKTELVWLTLAACLFLGLNVVGALMTWEPGDFKQHRLSHSQLPIPVEVHGLQFRWYFRYAGKDGKFGRTDPRLVDASEGNPLGLDKTDPATADDVVSTELVLPADTFVSVNLSAQDVIHSFFVPALRVKQDALPGQSIGLHLDPVKAGTYDIACAQLCGMGHYQMDAKLKVVPEAEYKAWLTSHSPTVAKR